jgi:hypothetical protein
MLRIPCPKCKDSSYTSDVESYNTCPICGFVFSGKYGSDRRSELRIEKEIPFVFSYKGQEFEARTFDFSQKGVGIKIHGGPPLSTGDALTLTVGDLCIIAKVKWVKRLTDKSLAGLAKLN